MKVGRGGRKTVDLRRAASASCVACDGALATSPGRQRSPHFQRDPFDSSGASEDRPPCGRTAQNSAGLPWLAAVRRVAPGGQGGVGSGGSDQASTSAMGGTRNHPPLAPPPRPAAVAGKKGSAWPNSMTSLPPARKLNPATAQTARTTHKRLLKTRSQSAGPKPTGSGEGDSTDGGSADTGSHTGDSGAEEGDVAEN
jgi:hypothetical protein